MGDLLKRLMIASLLLSGVLNDAEVGADDWRLVRNDRSNDITVYYRKLATGDIELRAVTHVVSSLSSFVALFEDVEAMPEWVDRTEKVKILKRITDREVYAYTVNRPPWPLRKRDAVVHTLIEQDPKTLAVTIRGEGAPEYIARNRRYVRIPIVKAFWKFTPQRNGGVEVVFQGYADPGGSVPLSVYRWLCRIILWNTPYKTLKKMKNVIKREKYKEKTFYFIKEPDPKEEPRKAN